MMKQTKSSLQSLENWVKGCMRIPVAHGEMKKQIGQSNLVALRKVLHVWSWRFPHHFPIVAMFCSICGSEIEQNANFCASCGKGKFSNLN